MSPLETMQSSLFQKVTGPSLPAMWGLRSDSGRDKEFTTRPKRHLFFLKYAMITL